MNFIFPVLVSLLISSTAFAGKADVVGVSIDCDESDHCDISATVLHDDEGWDHYADRWELLSPSGGEVAVRTLAHPHVGEQPFTRSLRNIQIPEGATVFKIRAHDSVHGYGGKEATAVINR